MHGIPRIALSAGVALLVLASAAHEQVTMNSLRVAAVDTVAVAKFYQAAFGMHQVNRIDLLGEIFLNFGTTVDAAKANRNPPLVLMHRDSDALKDWVCRPRAASPKNRDRTARRD